MKPSTRCLPESSLVNYLGQVFHINVRACSSFDELLELLDAVNIRLPGMTLEDGPVFVADRMQLHAALYNLREGSQLMEILDSLIPTEEGGAYVVMQDTTFTGKDGLFLLSASLDGSEEEAYSNNIKYMTEVWGKLGNPVARMITGGCRLRSNKIMSVVALQLSSVSLR